MLAWATVNATVTGEASVPPARPCGPPAPDGMVSVSLLVGMNGAVASKVMVAGPDFCQVPATAGLSVGLVHPLRIGEDRVTETFWSEGTSMAPPAGVVATTVSGGTALDDEPGSVPVVRVDAEGPADVCRPARNAPTPTTATTATTARAIHARR